jgi:hypothetical protein
MMKCPRAKPARSGRAGGSRQDRLRRPRRSRRVVWHPKSSRGRNQSRIRRGGAGGGGSSGDDEYTAIPSRCWNSWRAVHTDRHVGPSLNPGGRRNVLASLAGGDTIRAGAALLLQVDGVGVLTGAVRHAPGPGSYAVDLLESLFGKSDPALQAGRRLEGGWGAGCASL